MTLINIIIILLSLVVFGVATKKAKNNSFYQDSWVLSLFGIYVWGDALVLAPFWAVSGFLFGLMTVEQIIRYLLLFYAIRSFYEVMYWITHQVARRDYQPPLFRHLSWLKANEAAILYQLIHTCIFFWAMVFLVHSFL